VSRPRQAVEQERFVSCHIDNSEVVGPAACRSGDFPYGSELSCSAFLPVRLPRPRRTLRTSRHCACSSTGGWRVFVRRPRR
jgi:hypothetical protein